MGVGGQLHAQAALPLGKSRYLLYRGLGGPQDRSGRVRKISPLPEIRSPARPSHSESLYWLSYPGPPSTHYNMKFYYVFRSTWIQGYARESEHYRFKLLGAVVLQLLSHTSQFCSHNLLRSFWGVLKAVWVKFNPRISKDILEGKKCIGITFVTQTSRRYIAKAREECWVYSDWQQSS
jgi:hypothetical protein